MTDRALVERRYSVADRLTQIESLARSGIATDDPEHSCPATDACIAILTKVKRMLDAPEGHRDDAKAAVPEVSIAADGRNMVETAQCNLRTALHHLQADGAISRGGLTVLLQGALEILGAALSAEKGEKGNG